MLLAIPYFAVAYWCTTIIGNGGLGWVNLIVLICVWSGLKILWIGPHQRYWCPAAARRQPFRPWAGR